LGFLSSVSNEEIKKIVIEEFSTFQDEQDIVKIAQNLLGFARENKLGRWKRSRFSVELISFFTAEGASYQSARFIGNALDLFLHEMISPSAVDSESFGCGLGGALQLADGFELTMCEYAGSILNDRYIINAEQRKQILEGYFYGWMSTGNKGLAEKMTSRFHDISVTVAYGDPFDLSEEDITASRRGVITEVARAKYAAKIK
jgi:hypothetical protein